MIVSNTLIVERIDVVFVLFVQALQSLAPGFDSSLKKVTKLIFFFREVMSVYYVKSVPCSPKTHKVMTAKITEVHSGQKYRVSFEKADKKHQEALRAVEAVRLVEAADSARMAALEPPPTRYTVLVRKPHVKSATYYVIM